MHATTLGHGFVRGGLAAILLAALPTAAAAQGDAGKQLYLRYCGACHGSGGKGDGLAGSVMQPKPPDLTQLAKRSGGEFRFYEVMKAIDGRGSIRAHGDPDMPVWGELLVYWEGTNPDREIIAAGKVTLITEYVRSIQAK
jgi:mono/diheme cytochrome c family protein